MSRNIFDKVFSAVALHNSYVLKKKDCKGEYGISSFVNINVEFGILAYGLDPGAIND